jgi:hypothetical protein
VAKENDPRSREPRPLVEDDAEDRAAILRRRAMFVASAIAGLAACSEPQPCLKVAIPPDPTEDAGTASDAAPEACLSVAIPTEPPDAGAQDSGDPAAEDAGTGAQDAGTGPRDAGAQDAGPPKPRPRPCLKKAPPRPCLNMIVD